jgi:hypothetical protein
MLQIAMVPGFGLSYAVLADQTGAVRADTTEGAQILAILFVLSVDFIQHSSSINSRY